VDPLEDAHALVQEFETHVLGAEPEARRRAGQYTTPRLLVRVLVARVLEPLVARADREAGGDSERAREKILALRVLDPACGAGAFLLGVLEFLTDALVERGAEPGEARARLVGETLLGLDTDERAVLRAREALRLASGGGIARGVRRGDALADRGLAREAGVPRLDAVLGNPPYLREKDARADLARARATALGRRYGAGKMDLWFLFAHAALESLPEGGRHGFVVPAYWLDGQGAARLRAHFREAFALDLLLDLGARRFFAGVQGRHVVYSGEVVTKDARRAHVEWITLAQEETNEPSLEGALLKGERHPSVERDRVSAEALWLEDGRVARVRSDGASRIEERGLVAELVVGEGVTPGPEAWTASVARRAALVSGTTPEELERRLGIVRGEGVFVLTPKEIARAGLARARTWLEPWAAPSEVPAFPEVPEPSRSILYVAPRRDPGREPPNVVLSHLARFRPALDRRRETVLGRRAWFELHWPRERALFRGPRVLLPRMVARPRAAFVEDDLVTGESVLVLRFPDRARTRLAAALLNTAPLATWLLARAKRRGVGIDVSVALARRIPWPRSLVVGELERVEPVARALERGRLEEAHRLAWELYEITAPLSGPGRGTRSSSRRRSRGSAGPRRG
jgi:hypothetical protein